MRDVHIIYKTHNNFFFIAVFTTWTSFEVYMCSGDFK